MQFDLERSFVLIGMMILSLISNTKYEIYRFRGQVITNNTDNNKKA